MQAGAVTYTGQGFSLKGDKERFVLPANFRKLVTQSSGEQNLLYASIHPVHQCLMGYGKSWLERQAALVDARAEKAFAEGLEFDSDAANAMFGDAAEIAYDNSGRLIIPSHLRGAVGIGDAIYFHGFRDTFLMWAPDVLAAQTERTWLGARAACAELVEKNAKGKKA